MKEGSPFEDVALLEVLGESVRAVENVKGRMAVILIHSPACESGQPPALHRYAEERSFAVNKTVCGGLLFSSSSSARWNN